MCLTNYFQIHVSKSEGKKISYFENGYCSNQKTWHYAPCMLGIDKEKASLTCKTCREFALQRLLVRILVGHLWDVCIRLEGNLPLVLKKKNEKRIQNLIWVGICLIFVCTKMYESTLKMCSILIDIPSFACSLCGGQMWGKVSIYLGTGWALWSFYSTKQSKGTQS